MTSEHAAGLQVTKPTGKRVGGAFTGTTSRKTIPSTFGSGLVEIAATENCYIAFGGSAVDAVATIADDVSRLFLAGAQIIKVPVDPATGVPYTHAAVISAGTDGVWQVEEVE